MNLPVKYISENKLNEIFNINFISCIKIIQSLLKLKKINQSGSIVFINSILSLNGMMGMSVYAASKGAFSSFAKSLALEIAPRLIRVNNILPGMVKTDMYTSTEEGIGAELLEEHSKLYPLGICTAEDVANTVVFLLSPASRKITGTSIVLDGGYSIK
jgi:NAD(P)-dependent dehydrogenase (short-subunit alcohol dehydrogenase family)